MLLLLFQVKGDRFGLDASQVIEVTPMVPFRQVPQKASYVKGFFNYRGTVVPVLDLSALISGQPCRPILSTRVILVDYVDSKGQHRILGLLAERVTETITCSEDDFQPSGIELTRTRFLGDVLLDGDGMIQRIRIQSLLPASLQKSLFKAAREEPA